MDKVSNESKKILLEEIIRELIINSTNPHFEIFNYQPQPVIFIVDDAQYIDKESWEYLPLLGLTEMFFFFSFDLRSSPLGSAPTSLLIVAMRDPTLNDDELQTRLTNLREATTTKYIPLLGLDNRYLTTLACQAMFVQRIPKDLEVLLTRKSDKFVSFSPLSRRRVRSFVQRTSAERRSTVIGFTLESGHPNRNDERRRTGRDFRRRNSEVPVETRRPTRSGDGQREDSLRIRRTTVLSHLRSRSQHLLELHDGDRKHQRAHENRQAERFGKTHRKNQLALHEKHSEKVGKFAVRTSSNRLFFFRPG